MEDETPRESITQRLRDMELNETMTFSDPVDASRAISDVVENAPDMKRQAYWRFHKTVARVRQQTGNNFRLGTQFVWDDRLGLTLITSITRTA